MRIDKFIWSTRLFKTRAIASKSCTTEKVKLNNLFTKPGKAISIGNVISIKVAPIWKTYKVIDIPKSRIGAKLVAKYLLETTSKEDLAQLKLIHQTNRQNKILGIKGRPTKKLRRDLDNLLD
ncbi:MAG: RNA-binding S4 domain-containing protein [Flavobacteriales bacterium]|nr:RNA-binding S4 domain-containing protein [Flavobacteriales bacterium]